MTTGGQGAIFWLVLAVVLFLIESATVQLMCVWFAFGALLAMIAAAFGASVGVQLLVFLISSVASIFIGRPFFKKRLKMTKTATNAEMVFGQTGVVLEEISNVMQTGRVTANGLDWTARSTSDKVVIPKDALVRAVRIDGVKLIVEPLSQQEKE